MITSVSRLSGQLSVLALFLLLTLSCTKSDDRVAAPQTIPDRILEDDQFSLLQAAMAYAGVSDALKSGHLTLFAPTDSAFQASGLGSVGSIVSMPREQVRAMLMYHVLYGSISFAEIPTALNAVETASKGLAFVNKVSDDMVYINNATLSQVDLPVANGYIHKIDRVLTPSTGNLLTVIRGNPNLTFLSAAIKRIGTSNPGLLATLTNAASKNAVTLFAPNDEAFRADSRYSSLTAIESANPQVLANTVLYHLSGLIFSNKFRSGPLMSLLNGSTVGMTTTANQTTLKGNKNSTAATIKQADITATNGVIHIIDKVLQP